MCVCVCESFSCFQKAIEGRRCYCWEGPGGPGRTAARLGWPARGEAAEGTNNLLLVTGPESLCLQKVDEGKAFDW